MSRKLSNRDFRSLLKSQQLALPSQNDQFQEATQVYSVEEKKRRREDRRNKKASRAKAYKEKLKLRQVREQEKEAHQKKYRDRAKELREGKLTDYDDVVEDWQKMDYQMSKYLGGDLKHTHMVKGLDFTLLNRIRQNLAEQDAEDIDAEFKAAMDKHKNNLQIKKDTAVPWKTTFARNILEQVAPNKVRGQSTRRSKVCQNFVPGRMVYHFNLTEDFQPLPKQILRSMRDVPDLTGLSAVMMKNSLRKRIKGIVKRGRKGRHLKSKRSMMMRSKRNSSLMLTKSEKEKEKKSAKRRKMPDDLKKENFVTTRKSRFSKPVEGPRKRKKATSAFEAAKQAELMDVDIFEGAGQYEYKDVKKKKKTELTEKTDFAKPRDSFHDIFGLGGITPKLDSKPQKWKDRVRKSRRNNEDEEFNRQWREIEKRQRAKGNIV